MDYSTIDLDKLRVLTCYVIPPTFHLASTLGRYWHPPGYPVYFTHGLSGSGYRNPARYNVQAVFPFEGKNYVTDHGRYKHTEMHRRIDFKSLWKPLPLAHPRVRLWVYSMYYNFSTVYQEHLSNGKIEEFFYPLSKSAFHTFRDDVRWNKEYRAAAMAEVAAYNKQLTETTAARATPDRHKAVTTIRKFYPEYQPEPDLISAPPDSTPPEWWKILTARG